MILNYLNSQLAIFDFGHLQGVNWGQSWTKNWNFVYISCLCKNWVTQNAWNSICTTMRTTCGQNFSSVWCWLLELLPKNLPKSAQLGPKPKHVVLLLGKVENNKSTEAKTWHPERVEEWSYYRLCENSW